MATKPLQAPPGENPRKIFDSALALVQKGRDHTRAALAARKQPIASGQTVQMTEKRALTDAARALAQLWKVSPHLVR